MTDTVQCYIYMTKKIITFIFGLITINLLLGQVVTAAPVVFYNPTRSGDGTPYLNECLSSNGNYTLTPPITLSSGSRGTVAYNCVDIDGGDTVMGVTLGDSNRRNGDCPSRFGGLDLGGFGQYCLSYDLADPMYIGAPTTSTTNGATADNPNDLPAREGGFTDRETYDCGADSEQANSDQCLANNPITRNIELAINFVSAGIGIVVTIMMAIGGIQYASAGGNPQAVGAAKKKITNAIIALLAFIFLWAFLMWLVPGGVL